jgi:hypothetical protein
VNKLILGIAGAMLAGITGASAQMDKWGTVVRESGIKVQ